MSIVESPKIIIILALLALGSSGYNLVNSNDSVNIADLEHKNEVDEKETQRRLTEMDTKIQIEMRLITAPLEKEIENLHDLVIYQRGIIAGQQMQIIELEKITSALQERTRP